MESQTCPTTCPRQAYERRVQDEFKCKAFGEVHKASGACDDTDINLFDYDKNTSEIQIDKEEKKGILRTSHTRPLNPIVENKCDLHNTYESSTECEKCHNMVRQIHGLLYEARIKENVIEEICEHCRQSGYLHCLKCARILRKFLENKSMHYDVHKRNCNKNIIKVKEYFKALAAILKETPGFQDFDKVTYILETLDKPLTLPETDFLIFHPEKKSMLQTIADSIVENKIALETIIKTFMQVADTTKPDEIDRYLLDQILKRIKTDIWNENETNIDTKVTAYETLLDDILLYFMESEVAAQPEKFVERSSNYFKGIVGILKTHTKNTIAAKLQLYPKSESIEDLRNILRDLRKPFPESKEPESIEQNKNILENVLTTLVRIGKKTEPKETIIDSEVLEALLEKLRENRYQQRVKLINRFIKLGENELLLQDVLNILGENKMGEIPDDSYEQQRCDKYMVGLKYYLKNLVKRVVIFRMKQDPTTEQCEDLLNVLRDLKTLSPTSEKEAIETMKEHKSVFKKVLLTLVEFGNKNKEYESIIDYKMLRKTLKILKFHKDPEKEDFGPDNMLDYIGLFKEVLRSLRENVRTMQQQMESEEAEKEKYSDARIETEKNTLVRRKRTTSTDITTASEINKRIEAIKRVVGHRTSEEDLMKRDKERTSDEQEEPTSDEKLLDELFSPSDVSVDVSTESAESSDGKAHRKKIRLKDVYSSSSDEDQSVTQDGLPKTQKRTRDSKDLSSKGDEVIEKQEVISDKDKHKRDIGVIAVSKKSLTDKTSKRKKSKIRPEIQSSKKAPKEKLKDLNATKPGAYLSVTDQHIVEEDIVTADGSQKEHDKLKAKMSQASKIDEFESDDMDTKESFAQKSKLRGAEAGVQKKALDRKAEKDTKEIENLNFVEENEEEGSYTTRSTLLNKKTPEEKLVVEESFLGYTESDFKTHDSSEDEDESIIELKIHVKRHYVDLQKEVDSAIFDLRPLMLNFQIEEPPPSESITPELSIRSLTNQPSLEEEEEDDDDFDLELIKRDIKAKGFPQAKSRRKEFSGKPTQDTSLPRGGSRKMLAALLKERMEEKIAARKGYLAQEAKERAIRKQLAKTKFELPQIREMKKRERDKSGTYMICDDEFLGPYVPKEMIKGNRIVRFSERVEVFEEEEKPLLFKVKADCTVPVPPVAETPKEQAKSRRASSRSRSRLDVKKNILYDENSKGVVRYALSDKKFVENGWTKLPAITVVKRLNIFKMEPVNGEMDWFERNRNSVLSYDSGELLANINEFGYGQLFYRSGGLALDYHEAKEPHVEKRYVLYSSGEKYVTILGMFDHIGNGVVFDEFGKVRLKYNQNEGVVVDPTIGPLSHWRWHCLNDPPLLQNVYKENFPTRRCPEIDQILKATQPPSDKTKGRLSKVEELAKVAKKQMVDIELRNLERITQERIRNYRKYKPFPMKPKYFKINDQMSLRINDQKNIRFKFRDGSVNIKINLGLKLIETDVVDSEVMELDDVHISLDSPIFRSESLENIKLVLDRTARRGT